MSPGTFNHISSRQCSFNAKRGVFAIEASSIGMHSRVNEICIQSHRTGAIKQFFFKNCIADPADRTEIQAFRFASRCGLELHVLND